MLGQAITYSRTGMQCNKIVVETDIKQGMPTVVFTGLLSQEVREAKERIRPALENSGLQFPAKKVTVNFSPADAFKSGTHFDLAIAVSILKAQKKIKPLDNAAYFGELTLSGDIKGIRGILPLAQEAAKNGIEKMYIPVDNMNELTRFDNNILFPVNNLKDLFKGPVLNRTQSTNISEVVTHLDFADIYGQDELVYGMLVAATGNHHALMLGAPGSGKTMCAARLPSIMPELDDNEKEEMNAIYSIAGEKNENTWLESRQFRTPHNSASLRALIGGGPKVLPGEASLAHQGILFLDEFLEFRSDSLQALRTVIERKEVYLSMRNASCVYPASFLLVAAANPCPCGYADISPNLCLCRMSQIDQYRHKLNTPLTDRIDLQLKAGPIDYKDLSQTSGNNYSSAELKARVMTAREIQKFRFKNENFKVNSEIRSGNVRKYCILTKSADVYMREKSKEFRLSGRAIHKVLKVARTIADLEKKEIIDDQSLIIACEMRYLDMKKAITYGLRDTAS